MKKLDMRLPAIKQIEDMVRDIPGWSPVDQLYTLFTLALATGGLEGDIVEIGSWCGRSAVIFGAAARITGNTKVHCIDLFPEKDDWRQNPDGSYSFAVTINNKRYGSYEVQTVWQEPFERDIAPIYAKNKSILDIFNSWIQNAGLEDIVKTCRGDSSIFARSVSDGFKCRLAFLDGDHGYDAVCEDIGIIERYLVKGGWICFDDAFSSYEGVNKAITDLVIESPSYELCQQMTRKFFVARRK